MSDADPVERFAREAVAGLGTRPRSLPCKYLYDARGSELFESICRTPEYYVTRADLALHDAHLPEIASLIGADAHVIEFGSGAGVKTRRLLASLNTPRAYTPIEISAAALTQSTRALSADFPDIEIVPVQADYTRPIDDAALRLDPPAERRIVYFPGSTISNFEHAEAAVFLERMGRMAGPDGAVLIGVDLLKDRATLLAAYDDAEGVTAAFNLNLLERMQRELDAGLDPDAFDHQARYNDELARIEMHLVARRPTKIAIGKHEFALERGESIHTESSHKYSIESFRELASRAGLRSDRTWLDPDGLFSMHWLSDGTA